MYKVGDIVVKYKGSYEGRKFKVTDVWHNGLSVKIVPVDSTLMFQDHHTYWWNVDSFRKLTKLEKVL